MTKLSINLNKFATLRNSRGGNNPDVLKAALDAERFGADGITLHPRPDERHIRYNDVREIKAAIKTELNIEGNTREQKFVDLVQARVNRTIRDIRLVGNLSNRSAYAYSEDDIRLMRIKFMSELGN